MAPKIWTYPDFERILSEMRPQVGRAGWVLRLARWGDARGDFWARRTRSLLKRAFPRRKPYFTFEANGVVLFGDRRDRYARTLAIDRGYEDASAEQILGDLSLYPGTYIDVGSNMGALAALIAVRSKERVVAVEPDPETARRAACTFALNGLTNVTLVQAAAGDACGEVSFFNAPGSSDASSVSSAALGANLRTQVVPLITVDAIVEQLAVERVGFLKIDVEGHEPATIRGAAQTIRRDRPNMFFEYHWDIAPKLGWKAEDVRDEIASLGAYTFAVSHGSDPVREFPPTRDMGLALNIWCRRRP